MLKIYAKREEELRLLPILAEFKVKVVASFPIKGHTRKIQGKNAYKVTSFPPEGRIKDIVDDAIWHATIGHI